MPMGFEDGQKMFLFHLVQSKQGAPSALVLLGAIANLLPFVLRRSPIFYNARGDISLLYPDPQCAIINISQQIKCFSCYLERLAVGDSP